MGKTKASLFQHATGQWAKKVKIAGKWKLRYFGKDKQQALDRYLAEKPYLDAGREPPPRDPTGFASVLYVCEQFAGHKQSLAEMGRIGKRFAAECLEFAGVVMHELGPGRAVEDLTPADFDQLLKLFAKRWGVIRQRKAISLTKQIFKHSFDSGFIERPVRFGPSFKGPSKRELRLHRAKQGPRMLEPAELRALIDAASGGLRPAILLGLNCGFNNGDAVQLRPEHIKGHWLELPRQKTGIVRRCYLWPETIEALKQHPAPIKSPAGNPITVDSICHTFRDLAQSQGVYRAGITFGALRHIHQTIGEQSGDSLAVKFSMGHADNSISDHYRERFPDERLKAVSETIRKWLFTTKAGE